MLAPRHLLAAWEEIERCICRADRVALFTDFDGTLVPISRFRDRVRLASRVRELLAGIAQKGVMVGVVSGRRLADLRARVVVSRIWYVGAHGYFLRRSGGPTLTLLTPSQKREMVQVRHKLARQLHGVPGILLEPKEATVAVHYRQASQRSCRIALATIGKLRQDHPHLHLLSGKKVWELLPDSRVNKWTTIQLILRLERKILNDRCVVFYLGDDATDERVFAKMKGISVAVGKHRHTAASYFLESPAEVRRFLERFSEAVR